MKMNNDIKNAKLCYKHLGGKLGELLLDYLIKEQWLVKAPLPAEHYRLSDKGVAELLKAGIDVSKL